MALKSKEWFYKACLREVQNFSPLAHLCWDILSKGIGQKDMTRGHVTQAIGATQEFLRRYPQHLGTIKSADRTQPFEIESQAAVLDDWRSWLAPKKGKYGQRAFGYNYSTLKGYLTKNLGGRVKGGGGGNDEFKRVLRLIAEFL